MHLISLWLLLVGQGEVALSLTPMADGKNTKKGDEGEIEKRVEVKERDA